MKYLLPFLITVFLSFSVYSAENPFDEKSFETVTKSDTEALRLEIEMLRNEVSSIQSRKTQTNADEGEDLPGVIMAEPLMVVNGHYFVRPVMGGLPKKVSAETYQRISGEGN